MAMVASLAACGGGQTNQTTAAATTAAATTAAATEAATEAPAETEAPATEAAAQHEDIILTIGTGDTGGAMYPIGSTIAKIVNDNIPYIKMNVETTGGSVDNARGTSTNELDLGLCGGDVAYNAQNGTASFEGNKLDGMSALCAYSVSTAIFFGTEASGTDSVENLKGKRLSFGMTGSSTAVALTAQLPMAGIELTDLEPQYISVAESAEGMQNGNTDAYFGLGTMPQAALLELANNTPCCFFSYPEDVLDKIVEEYPYYFKTTLPAQTFNGMDEDLNTFGVKGVVLVSNEMEDEVVYEICKQIWSHMDDMYAGHNSLKVMTDDFVAKDLPIALHPGAQKFWEEQGLTD